LRDLDEGKRVSGVVQELSGIIGVVTGAVMLRSLAAASHCPKLNFVEFCGRTRMTLAAWMKSLCKYLLPRFEIRPRIVLSPVLYWGGIRLSDAARVYDLFA